VFFYYTLDAINIPDTASTISLNLRSVIIPNTITIGDVHICFCFSLAAVTMGSSGVDIGNGT
jgi:hypothetical protein